MKRVFKWPAIVLAVVLSSQCTVLDNHEINLSDYGLEFHTGTRYTYGAPVIVSGEKGPLKVKNTNDQSDYHYYLTFTKKPCDAIVVKDDKGKVISSAEVLFNKTSGLWQSSFIYFDLGINTLTEGKLGTETPATPQASTIAYKLEGENADLKILSYGAWQEVEAYIPSSDSSMYARVKYNFWMDIITKTPHKFPYKNIYIKILQAPDHVSKLVPIYPQKELNMDTGETKWGFDLNMGLAHTIHHWENRWTERRQDSGEILIDVHGVSTSGKHLLFRTNFNIYQMVDRFTKVTPYNPGVFDSGKTQIHVGATKTKRIFVEDGNASLDKLFATDFKDSGFEYYDGYWNVRPGNTKESYKYNFNFSSITNAIYPRLKMITPNRKFGKNLALFYNGYQFIDDKVWYNGTDGSRYDIPWIMFTLEYDQPTYGYHGVGIDPNTVNNATFKMFGESQDGDGEVNGVFITFDYTNIVFLPEHGELKMGNYYELMITSGVKDIGGQGVLTTIFPMKAQSEIIVEKAILNTSTHYPNLLTHIDFHLAHVDNETFIIDNNDLNGSMVSIFSSDLDRNIQGSLDMIDTKTIRFTPVKEELVYNRDYYIRFNPESTLTTADRMENGKRITGIGVTSTNFSFETPAVTNAYDPGVRVWLHTNNYSSNVQMVITPKVTVTLDLGIYTNVNNIYHYVDRLKNAEVLVKFYHGSSVIKQGTCTFDNYKYTLEIDHLPEGQYAILYYVKTKNTGITFMQGRINKNVDYPAYQGDSPRPYKDWDFNMPQPRFEVQNLVRNPYNGYSFDLVVTVPEGYGLGIHDSDRLSFKIGEIWDFSSYSYPYLTGETTYTASYSTVDDDPYHFALVCTRKTYEKGWDQRLHSFPVYFKQTIDDAPYDDDIAPTLNINYPGDGATLSGDIDINITVYDNLGIDKVEYYYNDVLLGHGNYNHDFDNWDTTRKTDGTGILKVIAYDLGGNTTTKQVTVTLDNGSAIDTPPSCTLTYPHQDFTEMTGQVTLTVNASDNTGIQKVEYYIDGQLIGESSTPPYSLDWNSGTVNNGTHEIYARAYDDSNLWADSSSYIVSVNNQQMTEIDIIDEMLFHKINGTYSIEAGATEYIKLIVDDTQQGIELFTRRWGTDLKASLYHSTAMVIYQEELEQPANLIATSSSFQSAGETKNGFFINLNTIEPGTYVLKVESENDSSGIYEVGWTDKKENNYFSYPIGDEPGQYIEEGFDPELYNDVYPSGGVDNPDRFGWDNYPSFWHNYQDVGNFNGNTAQGGGLHPGEDWQGYAETGTDDVGLPIYAAGNGTIVNIQNKYGLGYLIVVQHLYNSHTYYSVYLHVDEPALHVGDKVIRDEVLTYFANTTSVSPHLHFEIRDGSAITITKDSSNIWPNGNSKAYYSHDKSKISSINSFQVDAAIDLMQEDGILDPSDFIDPKRK